MIDSSPGATAERFSPERKASFEAEVASRFGLVPNFFQTASEAPGLIGELWGFARSAYLDNPLPSLFKERLFVHLSRFCEVRYCIVRHVGFLVGNGRPAGDPDAPPQTVEQVVALLDRPGVPDAKALEATLARLEAKPSPQPIPAPETQDELDLFAAAGVLFLEPGRGERARRALLKALGAPTLELLTAYLAFIRTAHYWTVTHPDLALEDDVEELMRQHERLAALMLDPTDGELTQMGQRLFDELTLLRSEHDDRLALRNALRQQQVLINELNHRVKNTLSIIQSIATQTLKGADTPPEVRAAFMARLLALADAHDILTAESWESAELGAVVSRAVAMLKTPDGAPLVHVSGPLVRLRPKTAVALAMAIHELATNAMKYGSLSIPEGRVEVSWSVDQASRLAMSWVETGGPAVEPPKRRGFGSRLIERGLAGELGGRASLEFDGAGLRCLIEAPLQAVKP